jgi:hypothetical protein
MALNKLSHQYTDPLKVASLNVDGTLNAGSISINGSSLSDIYLTTSSASNTYVPLTTPNTTARNNNSQNISIRTGNASGLYSSAGSINIDSGTGNYLGGVISIGQQNAQSIQIGNYNNNNLSSYIYGQSITIGNTAATPATSQISLQATNTYVVGNLNVSGTVSSSSTGPANSIGYLGIPQNTNPGSSYNIATTDNGKHIYITTNLSALTILANSSLALPIGFSFVIINAAGVTSTIACADTLVLAGTGLIGTRTLAPYAMATLIKITSTSWTISGNGIS